MDRDAPTGAVDPAAGETAPTTPAYIKPPWWLHHVLGRVVPMVFRDEAVVLRVPGRVSGRTRRTALVVLRHEDERYLISPYGNTQWARNLRAAGAAQLKHVGRQAEEITVVEVPPHERKPLLDVYLEQFGNRPTVAGTWARLPDPADHPTFRIVEPRPQD